MSSCCFISVYKTHIYCFIQGMASNYEPTVISKPCMVLRLPRAHSLNHAWKSSKYVYYKSNISLICVWIFFFHTKGSLDEHAGEEEEKFMYR